MKHNGSGSDEWKWDRIDVLDLEIGWSIMELAINDEIVSKHLSNGFKARLIISSWDSSFDALGFSNATLSTTPTDGTTPFTDTVTITVAPQ